MARQAHIPNEEATKFTYEAIETQLKFTLGKVLTIVDAAIAPEQQNKAIKDMVKTVFNQRLKYLEELAYGDGITPPSGGTIISTGNPQD